jgi:hypothetical protein
VTRYVWDREHNCFVDPATRLAMELPPGDEPVMPTVRSDIQPYKSPVDGRPITSASERRDDLARNGCVPYEPIGNMPKGVNNPKYAAKYGMTHLLTEEARDKHKIPKKAIRAS